MRENYLFSGIHLDQVINSYKQKISQEIDTFDVNQLLNSNVDSLNEYFQHKYEIHVPILREDLITADKQDAMLERRDHFERDRIIKVKGTRFQFFVPFEGDKEVFTYVPSTISYAPPMAEIRQNELVFSYERSMVGDEQVQDEIKAIRGSFNNDIGEVKRHLDYAKADVQPFNNSIVMQASSRIEQRRKKFSRDNDIALSLGFPLRQRDSATNYSVPIAKKKIYTLPPLGSKSPFEPEPEISMENYEALLSAIGHMALTMERSPNAYLNMSEESLRHQFLVPLNQLYEGQATGETFNFEGKTDILIRVNGKNIFIAECKFWDGANVFTKTIDQILGYATWRDTKLAVLLFNRNKDFSAVLKQIPSVTNLHPNFKRQLPYNSETGFRFALHHRDDKNRELLLTVLAFEVPQ